MAAQSFSLREKRLIQVAILLVILVLVSVLLRGGGDEVPSRGPVQARRAPAPVPAVAAPPAPAAPAPITAAPVATVPAADLSGLRLHGLLASGAVISTANGGQRLVTVGREVAPGLALVRIEQNHAVLRNASGEIRLGFDSSNPAGAAPTAPATTGAR